ncbi:hypothetical protein F4861DRAFT_102574 [Xylaria intraflava]|nr:hypothetical protein F4861DRAFT_102574 [Xylaria intraflava]
MSASSISTVSIDGKGCTTVPRVQDVGGRQTTVRYTAALESSTSSATQRSTRASLPTTFSTSLIPTSTPALAFMALTEDVNANAPASDGTRGTQEAFASTMNSPSSEADVPAATSAASVTRTGASLTFVSVTSLTTFSSSQAADQSSGPTLKTHDSLTPTTTPGAQLKLSNPTSSVAVSDKATTTVAAAAGPGQLESPGTGANSLNDAKNVPGGGGISSKTTAAIAGGVIGGLAAIFLIAFLVWLGAKRLVKKRRSTLLTPLSTHPAYSGGEKGSNITNRTSLGPTTILEKAGATVGSNYHRLRGRVHSLVAGNSSPSVDLDRRNPIRLPDTLASHSIPEFDMISNEGTAATRKFADQRERPNKNGNSNWKPCNEPVCGHPNHHMPCIGASNAAQSGETPIQPASLTHTNAKMGQQEAGNNTAGDASPQRSQSPENGYILSVPVQEFEAADPFADSDAVCHDSTGPVAPETDNTFSDANSNTDTTAVHTYSNSRVSVETSGTRRSKFRSDPFDLDRPDFLLRLAAPGDGQCGGDGIPGTTWARPESLVSEHSGGGGGILAAGWGDPGPDVGPAALGRRAREGIGNAR